MNGAAQLDEEDHQKTAETRASTVEEGPSTRDFGGSREQADPQPDKGREARPSKAVRTA